MASAIDLPNSFDDALRLARELLSRSRALVVRGVVDAEAELIVTAAYTAATGSRLRRIELFERRADRFPEAAGRMVIVHALSRAEGRLLQHLTGSQAFLDHEYRVTPDVLVPRPETEILAVTAFEVLSTLDHGVGPRRGFEIGLGSGVLSIELLYRFKGLEMWASELVPAAARVASLNAEAILGSDAKRLHVLAVGEAAQVWPKLESGAGFDFVISNPPYLASPAEADAEVVAHEPATALYAPVEDALYFYRHIAEGAIERLAPGGFVLVELAHERAAAIEALFTRPRYSDARIYPDLTGRARVLVARKSP